MSCAHSVNKTEDCFTQGEMSVPVISQPKTQGLLQGRACAALLSASPGPSLGVSTLTALQTPWSRASTAVQVSRPIKSESLRDWALADFFFKASQVIVLFG